MDDCQLFTEYLKWFDTEVKKKEQNRQVLLFMDNAGVHNFDLENVQLKHTKAVFVLWRSPQDHQYCSCDMLGNEGLESKTV